MTLIEIDHKQPLWIFGSSITVASVVSCNLFSSKNVSSLKENRSFVGFGVIFGRLRSSVLEECVMVFKLKVDFRTVYGSEIRRWKTIREIMDGISTTNPNDIL